MGYTQTLPEIDWVQLEPSTAFKSRMGHTLVWVDFVCDAPPSWDIDYDLYDENFNIIQNCSVNFRDWPQVGTLQGNIITYTYDEEGTPRTTTANATPTQLVNKEQWVETPLILQWGNLLHGKITKSTGVPKTFYLPTAYTSTIYSYAHGWSVDDGNTQHLRIYNSTKNLTNLILSFYSTLTTSGNGGTVDLITIGF